MSVLVGEVGGVFLFFLFVELAVALATYVYSSVALMTIAKRTNTPNAWLAWIPIANIYLMTQIAGVSGWFTALIILLFIPFVNLLAILPLIAGYVYLWWKIAEARNKPGVMALLALIPIANLVFIGILAWSKD